MFVHFFLSKYDVGAEGGTESQQMQRRDPLEIDKYRIETLSLKMAS